MLKLYSSSSEIIDWHTGTKTAKTIYSSPLYCLDIKLYKQQLMCMWEGK